MKKEQEVIPGSAAAQEALRPEKPRLAGYETLKRILAYLDDGDAERHGLRSDVAALYNLMIRWRGVAQQWTPGGSEYMDPIYCERFIAERRMDAHRDKAELYRLRALLAQSSEEQPNVAEGTEAVTHPGMNQ